MEHKKVRLSLFRNKMYSNHGGLLCGSTPTGSWCINTVITHGDWVQLMLLKLVELILCHSYSISSQNFAYF